jgi:hypothetical protein
MVKEEKGQMWEKYEVQFVSQAFNFTHVVRQDDIQN